MASRRQHLGHSLEIRPVLPLGHAAFGVVCYAVITPLRRRPIPSNKELLLVIGATQLPDLIDKPAVFYGLLSSGRAAGHSIFGMALICGGFALAVHWIRSGNSPLKDRLGWIRVSPFVIGYGSHLLGDSYQGLMAGRWQAVSYLAWPFVPPPVYPSDSIAPWIRLQRIYLGGKMHPQWALMVLAVVLYAAALALSKKKPA